VWRGHTRDHGREQVRFYGCGNHSKRGARVCSNGLVARTAATDAHVLATPAEDVLRPTVINQAIALALDERAPSRSTSRSVVRLRVSSLCQSASFVCSHGSSTVRSITVAAATFIVHRRELIGPASTQSACAGIRADEADAHRHRTAFGRLDERTLLRVDSDALQRAELVGCAAGVRRRLHGWCRSGAADTPAELTKVTGECEKLAEAIGRGGRLTRLLDRPKRVCRRVTEHRTGGTL
jgi:hypothetical protein